MASPPPSPKIFNQKGSFVFIEGVFRHFSKFWRVSEIGGRRVVRPLANPVYIFHLTKIMPGSTWNSSEKRKWVHIFIHIQSCWKRFLLYMIEDKIMYGNFIFQLSWSSKFKWNSIFNRSFVAILKMMLLALIFCVRFSRKKLWIF